MLEDLNGGDFGQVEVCLSLALESVRDVLVTVVFQYE